MDTFNRNETCFLIDISKILLIIKQLTNLKRQINLVVWETMT